MRLTHTHRTAFTVLGEPKGNARHRTTSSGHTYTPKATTEAREEIAQAYAVARASCTRRYGRVPQPFDGPVSVSIEAIMPIRPSWPKWKRDAAEDNILPCTTKPDVDNIAKLVMDALEGVAFTADAHVYDLEATKFYGKEPRLSVTVVCEVWTR